MSNSNSVTQVGPGQGQVGSQDNPMVDPSPMSIAQAVKASIFKGAGGIQGLYEWRNDFWVWTDRWEVVPKHLIEDRVWMWLSLAKRTEIVGKVPITVDMKYNQSLVDSTVRCLEAISRMPRDTIPAFLKPNSPDPRFCIAFEDVVVDVKASAEQGSIVSIPRGPEFFDCVTVPCKFDPEAKCPRWDRANEEWSDGDALWVTLNKREHGYCLMPFRGYAKWFMHYGVTRGGKGTNERIRKALIGDHGYMGVRMSALGKQFGLHKIAHARVLVVSEVTELEKRMASEGGGFVKSIVGMDPIDIDKKYQNPLENVTAKCAVILQGNRIPRLPNEGGGLTSKMVPLNFDVSFKGKENEMLEDELLAELPGIARWAVEGAIEVLAAKNNQERWPVTQASRQVMVRFHLLNNPADSFLEWGFNRSAESVVSSEYVYDVYKDWCRRMQIVPEPRNKFNGWLEGQNSWGVCKGRTKKEGRMGFKGMAIKLDQGYSEEHLAILE